MNQIQTNHRPVRRRIFFFLGFCFGCALFSKILFAADYRTEFKTVLSKSKTTDLYSSDFFKIATPEKTKALLEILGDEGEKDNVRWASMFGVARLAGKQSVGILKKYLSHGNWILRDAALKAAAAIGARELASEIETCVKDKALVVRTTAVDTIGHLVLKDATPTLLNALFDPINYNGEKALWIHKHILSVLESFNDMAVTPRLVELLEKTRDEKLRGQVIATLEKLTGKRFTNVSMSQQIYLWKRNALAEKTF